MIEVLKFEESGCGDILSQEFLQWRTRGEEGLSEDIESAKKRLLQSINNIDN